MGRNLTRKLKGQFRYKKVYQKAGGDWQSYCAACGKPLSTFIIEDKYRKGSAWMNQNIGFDSEHELILELGPDTMVGSCNILVEQSEEMNKKINELFEAEIIDDMNNFKVLNDYNNNTSNNKIRGLVLHKACVQVFKNLGIPVDYGFVQKLHAGCGDNKDYQEQEYDWESALESNPKHYKSPLVSKTNRTQLLRGCGKDILNYLSKQAANRRSSAVHAWYTRRKKRANERANRRAAAEAAAALNNNKH